MFLIGVYRRSSAANNISLDKPHDEGVFSESD